jgi:protein O-GlcNAc transferase
VAHLGLADIAAGQKQSVEAKKHYKLSIAFRPSVEAYQGLAKVLIEENEDREAAITLQRALFIKDISNETRFEVHKASANCLFRSGDAPNALREYEKALEVRPGDLEIYCNLGTLYLEQGKYENARGYFLKSLDKDPKKETAALGMGLAEIGLGQREAAYDWFLKTLEIQPKNSTAMFNLVKCAYELKRYDRAESLLSSYVEGAPVSPYLLYSLAGLHFHVGKFEAAARVAHQVLQIKPDHSGAKALLELIERQNKK